MSLTEEIRKRQIFEEIVVLNKNWKPIGYTDYKKAFCLVYTNKARIISKETYQTYDWAEWLNYPDLTISINSTSGKIAIPQVIILIKYDKEYRFIRMKATRSGILRRDNYTCMYCSEQHNTRNLTIDHIIPRCFGGQTTWTNCVCACKKCNSKKGCRSLEDSGMKLLKKPEKPEVKLSWQMT